jgi:hypothetical protein
MVALDAFDEVFDLQHDEKGRARKPAVRQINTAP